MKAQFEGRMLIRNESGQDGQNHDANIKKAFLVWAYCYIIGSQSDSLCNQGLPHPDKGSFFCHMYS